MCCGPATGTTVLFLVFLFSHFSARRLFEAVGTHDAAEPYDQALLLEEGAEVFAKPELEIYADDVECAHGNTSGQLDETALFYMRQRGIPLADARALLTEAFIADALQTAHESVRDDLLAASRGFLRGKA